MSAYVPARRGGAAARLLHSKTLDRRYRSRMKRHGLAGHSDAAAKLLRSQTPDRRHGSCIKRYGLVSRADAAPKPAGFEMIYCSCCRSWL
jgi:hypothetical protein